MKERVNAPGEPMRVRVTTGGLAASLKRSWVLLREQKKTEEKEKCNEEVGLQCTHFPGNSGKST